MSDTPGGSPGPDTPANTPTGPETPDGQAPAQGGGVSVGDPPEEASPAPAHLDPPGTPSADQPPGAGGAEGGSNDGEGKPAVAPATDPIPTDAALPVDTGHDDRPIVAAEEEEPPPAPPVLDDEIAEEVEEGSPAWMMTFGDMMSLLLTFFILMFSMSTIEVEKFKAAAESLAESLGDANAGILPGGTVAVAPPRPPGEVRKEIVDAEMESVADQLQQFIQENRLEDHVVVAQENHGVFLRMQNQALFPPGSAGIAEASVAIVEQLGSMLDQMDLPVKVSGHTDNVPIRSAVFPSNWELSAARAAGVARILVAQGHDPSVVSVEAFGEHNPVATNDTPAGRGQNRRVELYFARTAVEGALDERGDLPAMDGSEADVTEEDGTSEEAAAEAGAS
ncbi:MAG: OmpA/MotB family protein [Longimicrobiales bacterium]